MTAMAMGQLNGDGDLTALVERFRNLNSEMIPETRLVADAPVEVPEALLHAAVSAIRIEADLLEDDVAEALRLQDYDKIDRLYIVEHAINLRDDGRIPPAVASRCGG